MASQEFTKRLNTLFNGKKFVRKGGASRKGIVKCLQVPKMNRKAMHPLILWKKLRIQTKYWKNFFLRLNKGRSEGRRKRSLRTLPTWRRKEREKRIWKLHIRHNPRKSWKALPQFAMKWLWRMRRLETSWAQKGEQKGGNNKKEMGGKKRGKR